MDKLYARLGRVEVGDDYPVRVLGVINVSPESFYKGSVRVSAEEIAKTAVQQVEEGADIIDIGARSTAPYLETAIPIEEEIRRMVQAIKAVKEVVDVSISADTMYSRVAEEALKAGAEVINDVSGLKEDPDIARIVANWGASLIASAREDRPARGEPIERVCKALRKSLEIAEEAGVELEKVVIDPAIGFFRNTVWPWYVWDCKVLSNLEKLRELGRPICVGVSRKSFIGFLIRRERPEDRLYGSLATTAIAVFKGVHVVRTHDVGPTVDAIKMAEYVRSPEKTLSRP